MVEEQAFHHEDDTESESASSEEEEEDDEEEEEGSEDDVASWISWFCSLKGNAFFCEVEEDFIQDDFNLSGLSTQVPYYDYALDLILDTDSPTNECLTEEQHELVESAAEMLYGLIHVRYILTSRGMATMFEKYKAGAFGKCPRVLCGDQSCLPVGLSDVPRQACVKLFCPKCCDTYQPRSKSEANVDGAFFGTTFPHLLLMSYQYARPPLSQEKYVPRVFGFRLHASALQPPGAAGAPAGVAPHSHPASNGVVHPGVMPPTSPMAISSQAGDASLAMGSEREAPRGKAAGALAGGSSQSHKRKDEAEQSTRRSMQRMQD